MDDQSSPSNPKPPTQTLTANRKQCTLRSSATAAEYDYTKVLYAHNAAYLVSCLSALRYELNE